MQLLIVKKSEFLVELYALLAYKDRYLDDQMREYNPENVCGSVK